MIIVGVRAPAPPHVYIALREKDPLPMGMAGAPDQGELGDPF
jgi:hypothetical protein